jgi:hypothetical protein
MSTLLTPLRSRPYPGEFEAPDVAADLHTLALNLDQVPNITSGTTLPVTGMVAGDEFKLTTTGVWYLYTGSAWAPLGVMGSSSGAVATGLTFTPNTSTSYVNIATSGGSAASLTLVCTGRPVIAIAGPIGVLMGSVPAYTCLFGFSVDGAAPTFAGDVPVSSSADDSVIRSITPMAILTPSAGSHTITLQQKLDAGGAGCAFVGYAGQLAAYQV